MARRSLPARTRSELGERTSCGWRSGCAAAVLALAMLGAPSGVCASQEAEASGPGELAATWRNPHTRLEVALDPATGELRGTARLTLVPPSPCGSACERERTAESAMPEIELHDALRIEGAELDGRPVALEPSPTSAPAPAAADAEASSEPRTRRFVVAGDRAQADLHAASTFALVVRYSGVLRQDWAAGERAGEIHNFRVSAHIGPEGTYLSEEAAWYPRLATGSGDSAPAESGARVGTTDFEVRVLGVQGVLFVASGNRVDASAERTSGVDETWRTPFPLHGLTLAGGRLRAHHLRAGGVDLYALLGEESAGFGERLLEAAASYLALYQPLIGPYPFRELTIVENFFSSGFAYPGFTLLSSQVVQMGESSLRPGYLDHELLHAWWGNGVLGERGGSDWWEGLTSYCANLMRPTLEGRPEESRAQRRSILESLSQLSPGADRPLATFGLEGGASGLIGYQKGSLVFAQLARELGQETLWYALRTLAATRMGEPTGWHEVQATIERSSGHDLGPRLDFHVRGKGLVDVSPRALAWEASSGTLHLRLAEPTQVAFSRLPIRLYYADGHEDAEVSVAAGVTELEVETRVRPERVEIDRDFETLRRIPESVWMPTLSGLRPPRRLVVLRGAAEAPASEKHYEGVATEVRGRWMDATLVSESRIAAGAHSTPASGSLPVAATQPGHVLVLGDAAALPWVAELLAGVGLHIDTDRRRFVFEGKPHDAPTEAVLACVRLPQEPGAQICVYWGNADAALARSHLLTFYGGDSLLLFDAGRPGERRRFERTESYEQITRVE